MTIDFANTTPLAGSPLAVLDVETTGLNPADGHRICEIGIVRLVAGQPPLQFARLIDPCRPIPPDAMAVNGISNAMIRGAPRFGDVLEQLDKLLDGAVLVCHNAPFDLSFLRWEFQLLGRPFPRLPVLDTLALARRWFSFPSNSLSALAREFGLRPGGHRALGDAQTTLGVLQALIGELMRDGGPLADGSTITVDRLMSLQQAAAVGSAPGPGHHLPEELAEAVRQGWRLQLRYRDGSGKVTDRLVDPSGIEALGSGFTLVGYCHLRCDERTFRVDRIVSWRAIQQ